MRVTSHIRERERETERGKDELGCLDFFIKLVLGLCMDCEVSLGLRW